ncbi:MAG: hypothetical protein ACR2OC_07565 [Solirubrobacterales bacterium]
MQNAEPTATDSAPVRLRKPKPGALYPWVRRASWVEAAVFAALVFFWLAPGFPSETTVFGWAHGFGYLALLALLFIAVLRHEVPFWLLAATLTPLGPIGSVAGITYLDHRDRRTALR